MATKNNSTGFRGVIHFFSCWGLGDASVALIGSLLTLAGIGGEGKNGDWTFVAVGILAIIIYLNIAYLSRPLGDDENGGDQ